MAKVPQYKKQTAPVKTAGQAMLNAFANPQNVSSGIRAAQNTLNKAQDIGMKIFEMELKQSRATAVAEKEADFEKFIEQTNNDVVSGPPSQTTKSSIVEDPIMRNSKRVDTVTRDNPLTAIGKIQKSSKKEIRRIASTISDPVAKRRFITSANKRLASISPGITKNLRKQYNDHHIAVSAIHVNGLIKRAAGESPAQRKLTKREITEYNLALALGGSITEPQAVTNTLSSLSELDSGIATQMISEAIQSKDPSEALESLTKFVANKDNLTDLSTAARANKVVQLFKARESVERRIDSEIRRAKSDDKKQVKINQKTFKSEISGNIELYYKNLNKGGENTKPYTATQLRTFENEGKIPPGSAKALIELSDNEGKEQNLAAVTRFRKRISDAITKPELENIREEIIASEDSDEISPRSLTKLETMITRLQNPKNNPEGRDDVKYQKRIKSILAGRDKNYQNSNKILLSETDGQEMYERKRLEGLRPYEAFVETMTESLQKDAVFMTKVLASVPAQFRPVFQKTNGKLESYRNWTPAMVTDMEAKWTAAVIDRGETRASLKKDLTQVTSIDRTKRLSVRSLYRTEVAVRTIREFMSSDEYKAKKNSAKKAKEDANK